MKRWLAPRLLALHGLAVVAISACAVMGLWQLGVYGAKHEDVSAVARSAPPVPLLDVWGPDDAFTAELAERRVWIRGEFSGHQFRAHAAGADWWAAPLRVDETKSSIIVVRGVAEPDSPAPELPSGTVTFRGLLQPGDDVISIPALANELEGDLFSGYALTDAQGITAGLRPVEPPDSHVSWTVGLRNLAYALQWWVFGLFAGFMWWRMVTDALDVEDSLGEAAGDAPVT